MAKTVSVPYRGATFLNHNCSNTEYDALNGFRPLSGSYISQYFKIFVLNKNTHHSFRPLSGSYISQ